ncbi:AsmA-like C-terminal region-containing protein [Pleomorphomonas sp. NRK KF1]|uniref:AsmA family protein n=1 Tax=Pleomorphomonas sp. NRK KF1 TaxID=2943000 RepID=UPI0020439431|nr:AsmA-like C-terminal region-containing protein [Pleomorphomonas sp. NRK KF1]MCM5554395.1 hypothetical protein [Pleomorphomonas sp. NRK KF1]
MIRVITALSGLVLVVLALRLAMAPLFPLDKFVEPTIAAFEADTGTTVRIGEADLQLLPTPRVVASDVGIELPDGLGTVHADRLLLALNPVPFLSGSSELSGVTVERPVLRLSLGEGDLDPAKAIGALAGLADRASARHFQALDGRLTFSARGAEASLDGVVASASRAGDADRLSFKATLNGTPLSLTVEAGSAGATRAQLVAPALNLGLDGGLAGGAFAGRLDLSVPDAATLGGPSGAVKLEGAITLSSGRVEMVDATASLFGSTGRLSAAYDLAGPRASVDVHADFGRLPASSLTALAALASRIGFDPLGGAAPFDAGFDLKLAEMAFPGGSLRKIRVTAVDREGRFGARIDGSVGEGVVSGRVDLLPADEGRRLGASLAAKNVSVADVAAMAGVASPLTGRLSADLRMSAYGQSAEELAATLAIDGAGRLRDGFLRQLPLVGKVALPALSDLSADLSIIGLDKPARLTGQAKASSGVATFEVEAAPRRLIEGGASPVLAKLDGPALSIAFDGTIDPVAVAADGSLALTTRRLPTLVGVADLPPNASLDGQFEAGVGRLTMADARLLLGDSAFAGVLDLTTSGDRGRLTGRLSGDTIDISALAGAVAGTLSGATRSLGVDADLRIEAGGIAAGLLAAAAAPVDLRLDDKRAEIELSRLSLGGGSGAATLTVKAGSRPTFTVKGRLEGARLASLAPLIGTVADGEFGLVADIVAEGRTQRDLFNSAIGTAGFSVSRGVLDGVDPVALLGRVARAVQRGFGSDARRVGFDTLSGQLKLSKGVVTSDDLAFAAGDLHLAGAGSLRLGNGALDLRLKPKLDGYPDFEVPVAIVGPLAAPRLYPDLPGLPADPTWGYARLATMKGGFARLVEGEGTVPKLEAVKPDAMTSMIDQLAEPSGPADTLPVQAAAPAVVTPLPLARPADAQSAPRREKEVGRSPLPTGGPLDLGALGKSGSVATPAVAPRSSCRPGRDGRCIP